MARGWLSRWRSGSDGDGGAPTVRRGWFSRWRSGGASDGGATRASPRRWLFSPRAPLLSADKRKIGIAKAAWRLEDVMKDRHVSAYPDDDVTLDARALHFEAAQADTEHSRALLALVLLTIFETPSWCDVDNNFFGYVESAQRCQVEGVKEDALLLSGIPYIPPGWGIIIELVAVYFIARKFCLERKLQVEYFACEYYNLDLIHMGLFMVILEILDCIYFIIMRHNFRVAFVARTGFLCMIPAVVNLTRCISKIVAEVVTIACFYFATVIFFAWAVVEVFANMKGEVDGKPINIGFDTFTNSFNSLFVAGSTADFVSVFLPSYTAFRSSGLLWGTFLIIAKVLLLSLVLDTLVWQYKHFNEENEHHQVNEKVEGIRQVFMALRTVSQDGIVSRGVSEHKFIDFVHELSRSPGIRLSERDAMVVFKAVDKDGNKVIHQHEFCDICGVLSYRFWITPKYSPLGAYVESAYLGRGGLGALCLDTSDPSLAGTATAETEKIVAKAPVWVQLFVWFLRHHNKGNFDRCMNGVLLLNMIMVVFESMYDLNDLEEPGLLDNLELMFSFVYVAEVGLNLAVMSWGEYWSSRSYQFDFIVTWLLLFSSTLDEIITSGFGGDAKRYINILRLLRLLRVVKKVSKMKEVQTMVEAISTIVSASMDILTLLSVFVLFYSALGVQMWGGLLYEGNPALEETEYDEKDWYILNFQDVPMSLGVWVVSLLSEYVQEFPDALQRVSGVPVLSKCVFISFYLFSVCIVFELVKAFTIEVFLNLKKIQRESQTSIKKFKTLEDVKDMFDTQGQSLHYRVVGDPMLQVKMTEALELKHEELFEEEEEALGCCCN